MQEVHLTLLVEDLARLAAAVPTDLRYPALESAWARGQACNLRSASANHLRFTLFGIEPEGELPVAALTHVSDRRAPLDGRYYWLRADPVTMWADMARVFMTSYGFADLDPYERNEIENCLRAVFAEEGLDLHGEHPERWCIPLDRPLDFAFTPLDRALGMDVAEALPDHPEARQWRRILNEIQVALHHCPVNARRRAQGLREINSVWFWGGGFIPDAAPHYLVDTVYSDNAVSRGLAIINDCRLKSRSEALDLDFSQDGRAVLVDWDVASTDAEAEMHALESFAGRVLDSVAGRKLVLTVYDGSGRGRSSGYWSRRRFWRRLRPLSSSLPVAGSPQ